MKFELPEGFTPRPATVEDAEAVVACFNAAHMDMTGTPEFELHELLDDWKSPGFDLATKTIVVYAPNGDAAGYAEIWDVDDPPVRPFLFVRVQPRYYNLGIGTQLSQWGFEKAQECIERVEDPSLQIGLRSYTYLNHKPSVDLLTNLNLEQERLYIDMEINFTQTAIQTPKWKEGIAVKSIDCGADLQPVYEAFLDGWQDHYGFIMPQDKEADFERFKHNLCNQDEVKPDYCYVAMDGDEIAGLLLTRMRYWGNRDYVYVDLLTVRPKWRGQGIAKALLLHTFAEFEKLGRTGAALDVDASSLTNATKLYESVGMHLKRTKATYEMIVRPGKKIINEG